ncbi:hypothetical protein HLB03_06860, partial [Acidianus sp. DSM 29099]|nr:hypothetical protein [Acidianus sp. RZ1]
MCNLIVFDLEREAINTDNVVLLNLGDFKRIGELSYIQVLSSPHKKELSKSYYYYILKRLKELDLLEDDKITFRIALPYKLSKSGLELVNGILYITEDKKLVYYDNSQ